MPKRSDIEAQIAALQADLENADTDDEVWIKDEKGRELKVTGRRATGILDKFRDLWETADGGSDAGDDDEDDEPEPDKKPSTGYFGRKKG